MFSPTSASREVNCNLVQAKSYQLEETHNFNTIEAGNLFDMQEVKDYLQVQKCVAV